MSFFNSESSIVLYFRAVFLILGTVTPMNLSPSPYSPFSGTEKPWIECGLFRVSIYSEFFDYIR